jgi:hypothetical protein
MLVTTDNSPRRTENQETHVNSKLQCGCDLTSKWSRKQVEVMRNCNEIVGNFGLANKRTKWARRNLSQFSRNVPGEQDWLSTWPFQASQDKCPISLTIELAKGNTKNTNAWKWGCLSAPLSRYVISHYRQRLEKTRLGQMEEQLANCA